MPWPRCIGLGAVAGGRLHSRPSMLTTAANPQVRNSEGPFWAANVNSARSAWPEVNGLTYRLSRQVIDVSVTAVSVIDDSVTKASV